jgi:hypothetical protein
MSKTDIPSLADILALKPDTADAEGLRAAIVTATNLRVSLVGRMSNLAASLEGSALSIADKAFAEAERDKQLINIALRRVDELLGGLRADLLVLDGQETVAALREDASRLVEAADALAAWQESEFSEIRQMMGRGFRLEDELRRLHSGFIDAAQAEYRRLEVREAGAIGVVVPALPARGPRSLFPGWN